MSFVIRTCTPADLPQVQVQYCDLCRNEAAYADVESLAGRLCDLFLVVEEAGQILGFLIAAPGPVDEVGQAMAAELYPGEDHYLEVQELYVAPGRRGQGIGTALMQEVCRRGLQQGLRHSMVYTGESHYEDSVPFYRRCGYSVFQVFLARPLSPEQ